MLDTHTLILSAQSEGRLEICRNTKNSYRMSGQKSLCIPLITDCQETNEINFTSLFRLGWMVVYIFISFCTSFD